MVTDELIQLMHDDAASRRGHGPDLERIHRLARRRRATTRLAASAIVTVAVLGGVWVAMDLPVGHHDVQVRSAGQDHQVTGLTAYEKQVLSDVPGSYEVDGTVVLTDRMGVHDRGGLPRGGHISRTTIPLGFHASVGPGYLSSAKTKRAFQDNAPRGSQVVIDAGPAWLGCIASKGHSDCPLVVLTKDTSGRLRFLYGISGTPTFLQPGADMQLFVDDDFSDHRWNQTLIGGFHGTTTSRVLVETTDGARTEAQFDPGRLSRGNTVFWAKLTKPIAWVRAYDAHGNVLAEHKLRPCKGGVDCEVR